MMVSFGDFDCRVGWPRALRSFDQCSRISEFDNFGVFQGLLFRASRYLVNEKGRSPFIGEVFLKPNNTRFDLMINFSKLDWIGRNDWLLHQLNATSAEWRADNGVVNERMFFVYVPPKNIFNSPGLDSNIGGVAFSFGDYFYQQIYAVCITAVINTLLASAGRVYMTNPEPIVIIRGCVDQGTSALLQSPPSPFKRATELVSFCSRTFATTFYWPAFRARYLDLTWKYSTREPRFLAVSSDEAKHLRGFPKTLYSTFKSEFHQSRMPLC